MKCPYCGKEMVHGHISRDRYSLKFIPDNCEALKNDALFKGVFRSYIQLSRNPALGGKPFEMDYCSTCRIVIAPVKDFNKK